MRPTPPYEVQRARLVVLAVLLTNVGWVVLLPLLLIRPPTPAAVCCWESCSPSSSRRTSSCSRGGHPLVPQRTRIGLLAVLVAATLALAPVCSRWAEAGQEPWAWLVGFAIGTCPLVLRWRAAVVLGAGLTTAAVAAAVLAGQSSSRPW